MFVVLKDFGIAIRLRWAALAMAWNWCSKVFGGTEKLSCGLRPLSRSRINESQRQNIETTKHENDKYITTAS